MGIMSAKLFSAIVGGMNADFSNSAEWKKIGTDFKDVFSNKDFEGKDSGYPYSQDYYTKMRRYGQQTIKEAFATVADNLSRVHLGGSSGSEAVRQARINAGNMAEKPNKVEVSNYDRKIIDD